MSIFGIIILLFIIWISYISLKEKYEDYMFRNNESVNLIKNCYNKKLTKIVAEADLYFKERLRYDTSSKVFGYSIAIRIDYSGITYFTSQCGSIKTILKFKDLGLINLSSEEKRYKLVCFLAENHFNGWELLPVSLDGQSFDEKSCDIIYQTVRPNPNYINPEANLKQW